MTTKPRIAIGSTRPCRYAYKAGGLDAETDEGP